MRTNSRERGFTIVELLVTMTVFSIISLAIATLIAGILTTLATTRARAVGLQVANEKLEILRNLPYDSLATQFGPIFPPGNLLDQEFITRQNVRFKIVTVIKFVDDPYDGNATGTIPGKPVDFYPYDYKQARISVQAVASNREVAALTSSISAKAAETATNTGIISVKVVDASGQPVTNAQVHITNTATTPAVNITTTTDINGLVVVPLLPPDSSKRYKVVASLTGYNQDETLPPPGGAQVAVQSNLNVLVQQITNLTLRIDNTATWNLSVVNTSGTPQSGLIFRIFGSKKNYTNPDVYKYNQNWTTSVGGLISLLNFEWDSYQIVPPTGYKIVTVSGYQPVAVDPDSVTSTTVVVTTSTTYPTIATMTPESEDAGSSTSFTLTGTNLSGATLLLRRSGYPDKAATGLTTTSTSVKGTLNLTGVATGSWNIVVTTGNGVATQPGGFSVE